MFFFWLNNKLISFSCSHMLKIKNQHNKVEWAVKETDNKYIYIHFFGNVTIDELFLKTRVKMKYICIYYLAVFFWSGDKRVVSLTITLCFVEFYLHFFRFRPIHAWQTIGHLLSYRTLTSRTFIWIVFVDVHHIIHLEERSIHIHLTILSNM